LRGKVLELRFQIAPRGGDARIERIAPGGDAAADRAPGQQRLEIVLAVLAEAPGGEHRHHLGRQRIVAGVEHLAPVDRQAHLDAVGLQRGALEVEAHAVGEADLADAEGGLRGVGDDRARRAEIGIGEGAGGQFRAGRLRRIAVFHACRIALSPPDGVVRPWKRISGSSSGTASRLSAASTARGVIRGEGVEAGERAGGIGRHRLVADRPSAACTSVPLPRVSALAAAFSMPVRILATCSSISAGVKPCRVPAAGRGRGGKPAASHRPPYRPPDWWCARCGIRRWCRSPRPGTADRPCGSSAGSAG
jgi:hypothetical protein